MVHIKVFTDTFSVCNTKQSLQYRKEKSDMLKLRSNLPMADLLIQNTCRPYLTFRRLEKGPSREDGERITGKNTFVQ
jgi:hypothetical protein